LLSILQNSGEWAKSGTPVTVIHHHQNPEDATYPTYVMHICRCSVFVEIRRWNGREYQGTNSETLLPGGLDCVHVTGEQTGGFVDLQ
jgi:hypothetical protein